LTLKILQHQEDKIVFDASSGVNPVIRRQQIEKKYLTPKGRFKRNVTFEMLLKAVVSEERRCLVAKEKGASTFKFEIDIHVLHDLLKKKGKELKYSSIKIQADLSNAEATGAVDRARTEDGEELTAYEKVKLEELIIKYEQVIKDAEQIMVLGLDEISKRLIVLGYQDIADVLKGTQIIRGPPELFSEFESKTGRRLIGINFAGKIPINPELESDINKYGRIIVHEAAAISGLSHEESVAVDTIYAASSTRIFIPKYRPKEIDHLDDEDTAMSWENDRRMNEEVVKDFLFATLSNLNINVSSERLKVLEIILEARKKICHVNKVMDNELIKNLPEIAKNFPELNDFKIALDVEVAFSNVLASNQQVIDWTWYCRTYGTTLEEGSYYVDVMLQTAFSVYSELFNEKEDLRFFVKNFAETIGTDSKLFELIDSKERLIEYVETGEIDKTKEASRVISKVLVLDADGVLWKGKVGEDGVQGIELTEEHLALQRKAKELKEQGTLLVMCSKNNLRDVLEVFETREDMVLKKKDFIVIKANWKDKNINMHDVARELNLGIDCFVFIDDTVHERELIKMTIPEVFVITFDDIDKDVEQVTRELDQIFAKERVTEEDRRRTELYRANRKRKDAESKAGSKTDFLFSLNIKARVIDKDEVSKHIARISELTKNTNQFNLTLRRYSEEEIREMNEDDNYLIYALKISDIHGEEGLVGVIIINLESKIIDTFCLSCRVIGRGGDSAFMSEVLSRLRDLGIRNIKGEYIEGPKNKQVEYLYSRLGFKKIYSSEASYENCLYSCFAAGNKLSVPEWIEIIEENASTTTADVTDRARTEDGKDLKEKEKVILNGLIEKYEQAINDEERINVEGLNEIIASLEALGYKDIADILKGAFIIRGPPALFAEFESLTGRKLTGINTAGIIIINLTIESDQQKLKNTTVHEASAIAGRSHKENVLIEAMVDTGHSLDYFSFFVKIISFIRKFLRSHFFSILVLAFVVYVFLQLGLYPQKEAVLGTAGIIATWIEAINRTIFSWEVLWKTMLGYVVFGTLTDALAKRTNNEKYSMKAFLGVLYYSFIKAAVVFALFILISPFNGLVRTLMSTIFLGYFLIRIRAKTFHSKAKINNDEDLKVRTSNMYWLSRIWVVLQSYFIQVIMPIEIRALGHAIISQIHSLYNAYALHLKKDALIKRKNWVKAIQNSIFVRWFASIESGFKKITSLIKPSPNKKGNPWNKNVAIMIHGFIAPFVIVWDKTILSWLRNRR